MILNTLKDLPPWDWPDDAGRRILEVLLDDRAEEADRLLAAELAGALTVMDDELVEPLVSIVRNPDASVKMRGMAAIALGPTLQLADPERLSDLDGVPFSATTAGHIQDLFQRLFNDPAVPTVLRRPILEASVRCPQDWHRDAVRDAYSSGDEDWKLTAVFSMCWIHGFDDQILEALNSDNEDIHYEAVCAAGNWGIDAAWSHVAALLTSPHTDKDLLLAAIDAAAYIRPREARAILLDLTDSDDEDIAEAAEDALTMTGGRFGQDLMDGWDEMDEDDGG